MIPYSRQSVDKKDIASVVKILKSNFLTQGPKVEEFEKNISNLCRSKYVVASNSATSSLHIACLALNLKSKDIVWTVPNTFVASANCAINCGAEVDFVDIDAKTFNICISSLEKKLIDAKKKGKLPKILIPVHFAGQPTNQKKIWQLSKKYKFKIIEDASHSIGASFEDEPVGSCKWSDITVFSFHPVKIITTAEGGLATTNQSELAKRMQLLRTHGITRDQSLMTKESGGGWCYEQVDLGFNYRMTDLQAALGISQMKRLDEFVAQRHVIQERYDQLLSELPVLVPHQSHFSYSALHLYPIQIDASKTKKDRAKMFDVLREKNIGVNVHYIPVHTQPYYREMGFKPGDFPVSEFYYSRAISLPMFPSLSSDYQDIVILALEEAFR